MEQQSPHTVYSASCSDVGSVRKVNEDALLDSAGEHLWAVADGMGGHHAGDVASQAIVNGLAELTNLNDLKHGESQVRETLARVNAALLGQAAQQGGNTVIASTVTVLCIVRSQFMVIWAGDSRLYRIRGGTMEQVTRDHSYVQDLVDQGIVPADKAEEHPQANLVTQAIGARPDFKLDVIIGELVAGDRYLLCTDGLYRALDLNTIAAIANSQPIELAPRSLILAALERTAKDNVSVVMVETQGQTGPIGTYSGDEDDTITSGNTQDLAQKMGKE